MPELGSVNKVLIPLLMLTMWREYGPVSSQRHRELWIRCIHLFLKEVSTRIRSIQIAFRGRLKGMIVS
jgi:hypothetical protein